MLLRPPEFRDFTAMEDVCCEVIGQVYKIEYEKDSGSEPSIIYLNQISYFQEISKQQNQTDFNENYPEKNILTKSEMPEGVICYLSGKDAVAPKIGSYVRVKGTFETFRQATNPGEFDAKMYYRILGVEGKLKNAAIEGVGETYKKIPDFQFRLRCFLEEKLMECYPAKEAGILITMLLGNKTELETDIKELYRGAGILHILSVSGLHVSILGYGLYKVLNRLGMPIRFAAILALGWIWFYGGMIGMGVSAFRAVVMFGFKMLAKYFGRTYDLLTALAVAAALLIVSEPLYFYHSGFWLSFTCVLAISLLYPKLKLKEKAEFTKEIGGSKISQIRIPELKNLLIRLVNAWLLSFSVTLMTLPVMLWFYYEVSLWGLLWNLVIVPMVSVVMGGGIINLLLPEWTKQLSLLVARGNCVILSFFELLCRFSEWTGWGNLILGKPEAWQVILFAGGMIAFLFRADKLKYYQKFLVITALIGIMLIPIPKKFQMTFLDVGQGDGICLQNDNGNTYIVDGGSSSKSRVGTYQILPFLKHEGVNRVKAVFLSHGDSDHISGIRELLEKQKGGVRIEGVVLPDLEERLLNAEFGDIIDLCRQNDTEVYVMKRGMCIKDDKLMLTCLHPPSGYSGESNATSQVLYITYKGFSTLLTGDVEAEGEVLLKEELKEKRIRNVTVLKVAHHGSKYSGDAEFMEQVSPKLAVISCGRDNRYGHPHEETMQRLAVVESVVLTTPDCGAVTVEVSSDERISVSCWINGDKYD